MKSKIAFTIALLTLLVTGCVNTTLFEVPKTPEQLKAELLLQEQAVPLNYVTCKNVVMTPQQKKIRDGGLFRDAEYAPDGAIIKGEIVNTATLAKFKDAVVKISFYSQTNSLIDEKSYVIYEYANPNSSKRFSFKIPEIPQAQHSFSCVVTGATTVFE